METGSTSSSDSHFPRRFGPYVLVTHLGEGGMGRVYLALMRTSSGDELCVIKRFGNPYSRFTTEQIHENEERFAREGEISMALSHPGIARTFHSVHQGTDSYLVQEFVDGMTLEYLTLSVASDREHIPVPLAAYIVAQIARALAYVHDFRSLGLIHRDLTPTNVMFSRAGDVKVIDFGIAKATHDKDSLTKPNVVVGKPVWTAPEVLEGNKPDRRADLYALGLLFWYLLSGRDPAEHVSPFPSPSTFNPEVTAEIDEIVAKAVSSQPTRRFQTATEFLDVVSSLIPPAYQGPQELSNLLARREGLRQKDFFNALVDRARPLLDEPTSTVSFPKAKRRGLLMVLITVGAFAIGAALYFGIQAHRQPDHPFLLSTAQVPPIPRPPAPDPIPVPPAPNPALPKSPSPSIPPKVSAPPLPTPPAPSSFPSPPPRHPRKPPKSQPAPATSDSTAEQLLDDALDAFARSEPARALFLARASANQRANPDAYILISRILFMTDPAGARTALEKALRLSPGNRQASRLLEDLKQREP